MIGAQDRLCISAAQRKAFLDDGYLVIEQWLGDEALDPVIAEVSQAIDAHARELTGSGKLSSSYAEYDFAHRLAMISRETDEVALSIWSGALHGPAIFNLIRHPRLLDLVEAFTGPEIIASSAYRLRPKIPHYHFGEVPWHQDSGYFESYCDQALILTVWVPLVDTHADNGCLWVIPGAHHRPVLPHRLDYQHGYLVIDESNLPAGAQPVCCSVPKGGVLLLHNRIPHVSYENKTDAVRWSMDLRYQSAALPTNAPITRLPGESQPRGGAGTGYEDIPAACYPPEADFLVRSRARPREVIADADSFARLRQQHVLRPVTARWSE